MPLNHVIRHGGRIPTFVVLALLFMLQRPTFAQGLDKLLPGPITADELSGYAERLGLSPEQQWAMLDLHAAYREQFASYVDGLACRAALDAFPYPEAMVVVPGDEARRRLGLLDSARRDSAALDERFFADLSVQLSDAQEERLPRLRMERERVRDRSIGRTMGWTTRYEVDPILRAVDLDVHAAGVKDVRALVQTYDRDLTELVRQYRMEVEQTRFREPFDEDAEPEAAVAALRAQGERPRTQLHAMAQRMVELAEHLRSVRPGADGRRVWRAVLAARDDRVRRFLLDDGAIRDLPWVAEVLMGTLPDEEREEACGVFDELEQHAEELMRGWMQLATEDETVSRNDHAKLQQLRSRRDELQEQSRGWRSQMISAMDHAFGAAWRDDPAVSAHRDERSPVSVREVVLYRGPDDPERPGVEWALMRRFVSSDMRRLVRLLEPDEADAAAMAALLEVHAADVFALEEVRQAISHAGRITADVVGMPSLEEGAIAELERARESMVRRVTQMESQLLDRIADRWSDDEHRRMLLELFRTARRIDLGMTGAQRIPWAPVTVHETGVNLLWLIVDDDVLITSITTNPAEASVVTVLREQLEVMREASARRFDAALPMRAIEDRRLLAGREDADASGRPPDTLERQRAIRLLDADDALAAVIRHGVERVANQLPVMEGERLMQAYERAAFPEIVDVESAGPAERYARIAASPAIEREIRQRAADVMIAWRAARHELREALTAYDERVRRERRAAVMRAAGSSASSGQPDIVQRRAADRIRFEMGEIDRLAVLRLHAVLTPEQAAAVR